MMKHYLGFWMICMVGLLSCKTAKNYSYFKDIPDSVKYVPPVLLAGFVEPRIKKGDILQISILTLDPDANLTLSNTNSATFSAQNSTSQVAAPGFLVDNRGIVELPIIGSTFVEGLTTTEAKDSLQRKVALYYKNPIINIRFLNFSVTVLGEVAHPGTFSIANEKVSVLDALGLAGDITVSGRRDNLLLIRDSVGHKQFVRLDLTSSTALRSPFFYLKQGDMLYVEPTRTRANSADAAVQARNYALIASLITVITVIISRF